MISPQRKRINKEKKVDFLLLASLNKSERFVRAENPESPSRAREESKSEKRYREARAQNREKACAQFVLRAVPMS